jgi:hypothetical protein
MDLRRALWGSAGPPTILVGTHDHLTPLPRARELAAAFPEIERITFAPRLDLLEPDSSASSAAVLIGFGRKASRVSRRDILRRSGALLRQRLAPESVVVLER